MAVPLRSSVIDVPVESKLILATVRAKRQRPLDGTIKLVAPGNQPTLLNPPCAAVRLLKANSVPGAHEPDTGAIWAPIEGVEDPVLVIVTAPVAADKLMPFPAKSDVTPVFDRDTAPVGPEIERPGPTTAAEVTPVLETVATPAKVDTEIAVPPTTEVVTWDGSTDRIGC